VVWPWAGLDERLASRKAASTSDSVGPEVEAALMVGEVPWCGMVASRQPDSVVSTVVRRTPRNTAGSAVVTSAVLPVGVQQKVAVSSPGLTGLEGCLAAAGGVVGSSPDLWIGLEGHHAADGEVQSWSGPGPDLMNALLPKRRGLASYSGRVSGRVPTSVSRSRSGRQSLRG
jgi:hypothetical protein